MTLVPASTVRANAASLIERMEQEGLIGPANHAGKREILVPTEADVLDR